MDYVQYPNYTTEFSAFEVSSTVGPCKITLFEVSTALFHLPIASNEVDVPKKNVCGLGQEILFESGGLHLSSLCLIVVISPKNI
mmetsp:Transcript_1927/g.4349  ORF Transcript_1927/g.4349 Transcript_1927/m.4349 type:complete len:84 (+) Transcript_1927:290-541(+)